MTRRTDTTRHNPPARAARPARRAAAVTAVSLAGVLAMAGGAWAFVGALGGGQAVVSVDSSIEGIAIVGNSSASIVPGQPAPLSIKLLNGNTFPVRIGQVTVRVSQVEGGGDQCSPSDFTVTVPDAGPVTVPARGAHGDGLATWPNGSVELALADRDQSGCLGRTVYLRYDAR